MKYLLIALLLLPMSIYAQDLGNTVRAPMPIDLDKDTTYIFSLNKQYCQKSNSNLFGVKENGSFSYKTSMPFLYITHNFSLGCCTSDFYQIKIKSNNIYVSVSDTGELCPCGLCTYFVCFYDPNPQKDSYHLHMNCLDTIVSIPTTINSTSGSGDEVVWNYENSTLRVQLNRYEGGDINLKIYNYLGQIICNQVKREKMFNIALPSSDRFYIMNIEYGGKVYNYKIMSK